ncbi:zf-HC2 domain-containing protein [Arthrobacter gandavensis]|uniref:zf-HC2 domain-containing protein n=1 Tax=Arthrobacter gandavensis TaxID=169960 RepID=UPI00188E3618|nr:zf-HC2 domain-containing protein [Arthrobacter gandavensis]MBF4993749.1 zf-HC2 domain-containing protein [Arthrobacter gandavensis]
MRHPKRHLRSFLDEELPARRRAAIQTHLSRCAACRCAVEEERRLRSRLRALKVPAPREDLASRIVADSAARPAPSPGAGRARYAAAVGGILAMVSGFVLAGAYILGSIADDPLTGPQQAHLLAGWNQLAEQRAGSLSAEDVEGLRKDGWSCPDLDALGFTLASARTLQVAGHPAVAMELNRNGETLTVYEQRPRQGDANPEVLHAVSGRPVAEEGFSAVTVATENAPRIWRDDARPGEAVLSARNVTYTLTSSTPGETLSSAVAELSLSESARLLVPAKDPGSGAVDRVLNGLALLAGAGHPL